MSLGEHILSLGLFTYSSGKPGELIGKLALQIYSSAVVAVVVVDVQPEE